MNVQPVYASLFMGDTSGPSGASAALLDNGSVVTRGDSACGGAGSVVQEQLRNEQHVQVSVSHSLDCLALGAWCPGAMLIMVGTPVPSRNSG